MCSLCALCLSCARQARIPVDEALVRGGSFTVGDGVSCGRYEATVGDLVVSRYEITWGQFASAMNYALSHKLAETRMARSILERGFSLNTLTSFLIPQRVPTASRFALGRLRSRSRLPECRLPILAGTARLFSATPSARRTGFPPSYDWDSWDVISGARGYRMPSYEEWEYLVKGGSESRGCRFAGSNDFAGVAWFALNSGNEPHEVGGLKPNELGLYDMSGNVSEFCTETYRPIITAERTKGLALKTSNRIWRGGSFKSAPVPTTYFYQNINNPEYYFPFADVGLRTVRAR